jgi:hypothetical protein
MFSKYIYPVQPCPQGTIIRSFVLVLHLTAALSKIFSLGGRVRRSFSLQAKRKQIFFRFKAKKKFFFPLISHPSDPWIRDPGWVKNQDLDPG